MKKLTLLILLLPIFTFAQQDSTISSAFKNNLPRKKYPLIKPKYPSYPLMTGYLLKQEAQKGDPFAQHELGLRYLLGRGFAPDTILAVHWIKKAANQSLTAAQFNYGIMQLNGTGTEWSPFEAYKNFEEAAYYEMPEAQYMYGVLMLDNLIVNKNITEAYRWIKRSSDAGFTPADDILTSMRESGIALPVNGDYGSEDFLDKDSSVSFQYAGAVLNNPIELDFIDFNEDSTSKDEKLIEQILSKKPSEVKSILGISKSFNKKSNPDTSVAGLIKFASNAGSPEALILEAKSYENGYLVKQNKITAALKYIRSLRLGSQRAGAFLLKLIRDENFFKLLQQQVDKADPDAMYVWAGLIALGFDYRLNNDQALEFLESASDEDHVYSIIELGLCYYSGTLVEEDKDAAIEYWETAYKLGSKEARIRIILNTLKNTNDSSDLDEELKFLNESAEEGSVLADIALAYCYEKGIGVRKNKAFAVKYYRKASQRGNEAAFNSVKRMFDELRPDEEKFIIVE